MSKVRNIFEELKETLHDLTNEVGDPVENLHGVIQSSSVSPVAQKDQGWFVLTADAKELPSLSEFVNAYTIERSGYHVLSAVGGETAYRLASEEVGRAVMFFSTLNSQGSLEFPITVDAPGYDISVYVDKHRIGSGREKVTLTPQLSPGLRVVAVVVHGGDGLIEILTNPYLPVSPRTPVPTPPTWADNIDGNYLDAKRGVLANILYWANDAYAGAWNIYRARADFLKTLASGDLLDNTDGTWTVTFTDFLFPNLKAEDPLFLQDIRDPDDLPEGENLKPTIFWGTILEVDISGTDTIVLLNTSSDCPADVADALDYSAFTTTGFTSIAMINYGGTDVIYYEDTDVAIDELYFYKLTALGFLELATESKFSSWEWIQAGDYTPPGGISVISAIAERNLVRITFLAPADEDYLGVRVYGPFNDSDHQIDPERFVSTDLIRTELGWPSAVDQVFFTATDIGDYYVTPFDQVGNERAPKNTYYYSFTDEDSLPPNHVESLTAIVDTSDPNDVGVFPHILIDWSPPTDDTRYHDAEVQVSLNSGAWNVVGRGYDHFEYHGWWDTTHDIRVVATSKWDVNADAGTAPTAQVITDSADSDFMGMFTATQQYQNDTAPNGQFFVLTDWNTDDQDETRVLTIIGVLTT